MEKIMRGAPVAEALTENLKARAEKLLFTPCLAIVRVGEKAGDMAYERGASKRCGMVGIELKSIVLPESCTQQELMDVIENINADDSIHGCLVLRPLPEQVDEDAVCDALLPEKDMDCIGSRALSNFYSGRSGYGPCTAEACIAMLDHYGVELRGKNAAVIGRSQVIGRPVSIMLQDRDATVTMCHSRSRDLAGICRDKDIIIAAVGRAKMLDESFVSEKQVIVDVGINTDENGKLCGDVDFEKVSPLVQAISPVPGGIGAITSTILAKHVIEAAEKAALK